MGQRISAVCLVILAILPFSTPFATFDVTDLAPAQGLLDRSAGSLVQTPPVIQECAAALTDCPVVPRQSPFIVAVAVHSPVRLLPQPILHRTFASKPAALPTALRI